VKGFFLNNPFIYEEQMSFKGAIFVESDQSLSKKDFKKICQDFYVNGLSKLVIYRFGEADNKTWSIVPPEFSDRITINSAESIF